MKSFFIGIVIGLFSYGVQAGILAASRGGTGANITPVAGKIVTSTSSGFTLSTSLAIPAGGTVVLAAGGTLANTAPLYIPAGSTMGSIKQPGSIQSNGTNLYWVDGSGNLFKFNFTAQ